MAELYLVRHGQASFGADNYDQLSPLGHQQSRWLGEYFKQRGQHFDRILLGTQVRHRETADGILKGLSQNIDTENIDTHYIDTHHGLSEFDFDQVLRAYLQQHPNQAPPEMQPKAYFRMLKQAVTCWHKGELDQQLSETWQDFEQRVKAALTVLREAEKEQRLLVISSGGAMSMIIKQALELPDKKVMDLNMQIRNTSISQFFIGKDTLHMNSFNHVPHLEQSDRTDAITYS